MALRPASSILAISRMRTSSMIKKKRIYRKEGDIGQPWQQYLTAIGMKNCTLGIKDYS